MIDSRNPYTPPRAELDTRLHGLQKPAWPLVVAPYLIPTHLMVWSLLASGVLSPFGLAGVSSMVFWFGLLAWVYAYRKQPPHRKAERIWWAELRRRQQSAASLK